MFMVCTERDRCGEADCPVGKPHVFEEAVCITKDYPCSCRGLSVWCEEAPQNIVEAQTQQATGQAQNAGK